MERKIKWLGNKDCDNCKKPIKGKLWDVPTVLGPWATLCDTCANDIGTCLIQNPPYTEDSNGDFVKTKEISETDAFVASILGWDAVGD